jgi:hypothetical protein
MYCGVTAVAIHAQRMAGVEKLDYDRVNDDILSGIFFAEE